jgi:hypothetical protein
MIVGTERPDYHVPEYILKQKYKCKECGKSVFYFNRDIENFEVSRLMWKEKICWECAYWKLFLLAPPKNAEIIGDLYYQVYPYTDPKTLKAGQWLGSKETHYILRKNGECYRTNDMWLIAQIPPKYQEELKPTAWFTNKHTWESLERSKHRCNVKRCFDRYNCYRYNYRNEFYDPQPVVPFRWRLGDEHCPAFIPTKDIKDFDAYTSVNDINDERSLHP